MIAVVERPSPNFDERRGRAVDMLLLHYTGMPDCAGAIAWLADPASRVSSHYVVTEDGTILRMVPEDKRAWHAGVGSWGGESDVNARSIGIEICNAGHPASLPPFPDVQIAAVIALGRDILSRHAIPRRHVLGHSDTAPGRKIDPGEAFPWAVLARAGLGRMVTPAPIRPSRALGPGARGERVRRLQARLKDYGYGIDVTGAYDERTAIVVAAFQRHFRPALVDGIADASTLETLRRLCEA